MTQLPGATSAHEVHESLPAMNSITLRDKAFEIHSICKPLDVLVSSAAYHVGDVKLAILHMHASLTRHRNPIKLYHAHRELGILELCMTEMNKTKGKNVE